MVLSSQNIPYGGFGSPLDPLALPNAAARFGGYADLFANGGGGAPAPSVGGNGEVGAPATAGAVVSERQGDVNVETIGLRVTQPAPVVSVVPIEQPAPAPVMVAAPAPVMVATPVASPCAGKVRWICFKRWQKLLMFAVLFVIAMILIIVVYVLTGDTMRITVVVLAAVAAALMAIEYIWLGRDCGVEGSVVTCNLT